jgi:hypothetical protein
MAIHFDFNKAAEGLALIGSFISALKSLFGRKKK